IIMCDSRGAIYEGRPYGMNAIKEQVAKMTNINKEEGSLDDVLVDADVFIGVSVGGALTKDMIKHMSPDPILFAMANPEPEIMPEDAKQSGVRVIGTGRSDYQNQVNNFLAFPGIFRGKLDVRDTRINDIMKIATYESISSLLMLVELSDNYKLS